MNTEWNGLKYFKRSEFSCKGLNCCKGTEAMNIVLLNFLDIIREELGEPIIVTSGFRCNRHNSEIGGVKNSNHTCGNAVDITTDSKKLEELYGLIESYKFFDELINYPKRKFIHCGLKKRREGYPVTR